MKMSLRCRMHMTTTIQAFSVKVISTYLAPVSYHTARTENKSISRSDLSKIRMRACIGAERIGEEVEAAIKQAMLVVVVNLEAEIAIIEFSKCIDSMLDLKFL